jgi:hypothetical protein
MKWVYRLEDLNTLYSSLSYPIHSIELSKWKK